MGEGLGSRMKVSEHGVAMTPVKQADGVGVNLCKEKCHGAPCAEVAGADVGLGEANLWAGGTDNGAN